MVRVWLLSPQNDNHWLYGWISNWKCHRDVLSIKLWHISKYKVDKGCSRTKFFQEILLYSQNSWQSSINILKWWLIPNLTRFLSLYWLRINLVNNWRISIVYEVRQKLRMRMLHQEGRVPWGWRFGVEIETHGGLARPGPSYSYILSRVGRNLHWIVLWGLPRSP